MVQDVEGVKALTNKMHNKTKQKDLKRPKRPKRPKKTLMSRSKLFTRTVTETGKKTNITITERESLTWL